MTVSENTARNTTIRKAALEEKPILRQLLELYDYDFSELDGADVGPHGFFGYKYLDHYWTEPDRHPYLISASGQLAGFALVNRYGASGEDRWSLGEFFVMRKYRGQGIGEYAATCVFDLWPGKWEVNQIAAHPASTDFWRKVIGRYTHGQYAERSSHQGPIQLFDNSNYAPAAKRNMTSSERPVKTLRFDLRPAADADYDFLWHLVKETMQGYVHATWGWDEDWQAQRFRSNFDASQWRIITVGGQNAGGLQAGHKPSEDELFLSNIYLLPSFQNRGIGSAVVWGLLAEARTHGLPLTLNVLKSNPDARRLYERLGLRVVRENAERFFMEG